MIEENHLLLEKDCMVIAAFEAQIEETTKPKFCRMEASSGFLGTGA